MRRAANTEFVGHVLRVRPMAPDERQGRLAFVDGVLGAQRFLVELAHACLGQRFNEQDLLVTQLS
jgi:hypothetical protein